MARTAVQSTGSVVYAVLRSDEVDAWLQAYLFSEDEGWIAGRTLRIVSLIRSCNYRAGFWGEDICDVSAVVLLRLSSK